MKIIKKGLGRTVEPWAGYVVHCREQFCQARIKLEKGDPVKFNSDQRDGDFYQLQCPECKSYITIDADLLRKSVPCQY